MFGRQFSAAHPYYSALDELMNLDIYKRAMAVNLKSDFRVSEDRETLFNQYIEQYTAEGLEAAIVRYFEERIRNNREPDYLDETYNKNNLLTGTSGGLNLIHKDQFLVRIIDLNGLTLIYEYGKSRGKDTFYDLPLNTDDQNISMWLSEKLHNVSDRGIEKFINDVINTMNEHQQNHPFQPTWVSMWDAIEDHHDDPNRLIDLLGVYKSLPFRWIILLKYRVSVAGTLARPTQLDAGWYSFHFPSPPQANLEQGGHPMDLEEHSGIDFLLPEFIHQQIEHSLEHWIDAGRFCKMTSRKSSNNIFNQRKAHYSLLLSQYGNDTCAWMEDCI